MNCWRFLFSLRCVGAGRAVRQFDYGDNRQGDLRVCRCASDGGEHLPRVLSLALGGD